MKQLSIAALALALFVAAIPAHERAKIEALIVTVEKLPDAVFVRNGKAYKPATAAKFLRGKWDDRANEVHSAEDFITKVATRSRRPAARREIETAAFFRAELAKLR